MKESENMKFVGYYIDDDDDEDLSDWNWYDDRLFRDVTADLAKQASEKKALFPSLSCSYETELVTKLSALTDTITQRTDALEEAVLAIEGAADIVSEAAAIRDTVVPKMQELRIPCDQAELLTAKSYWPFPTYGDILFSVK